MILKPSYEIPADKRRWLAHLKTEAKEVETMVKPSDEDR